MKKIYILTAVFALLAMSLNAQLKVDGNGSVVPPKSPIEKVTTTPDGYFHMGPSRASTDPVTPPYTNGFTNTTEQNWWQVIDANSDNSTWTISSQRAVYSYNYSNAANDWLITAPVYLEVGKTYKFYIDAWIRSSTYPEKLEVKLASANTATALSNGSTIIASTELTSTTAQTLSNETVTVNQTGNYYFGIHAISNRNMYELYVDNLVIDVEDTDPRVTVSPDALTISDNGTNNTFDVEAHNIYNGENLGVTPHNGFSTTCTSSTNNVDTWGFYQNNGSVNGTVAVTYTGRNLTASDDIAVGTLGASTTVHVDYVPDLYIYCDNGASPWDFSANPAVAMTNNGDGTYTAMLQNIPANSHILFGRTTGLTYYWEGDNNRLFFGASTDGGDWGYGDNTSGYLDTNAEDDSPVKYHPIYFSEGGSYIVTIDANAYTFTITKLVYPAPENVVATADNDNQSATVTWDIPSDLPAITVTEGFDDQTVFEPFSLGGITATNHVGSNGGWTLYDPTGATVWGVENGDFPNMAAPHAWIVMNPSQATGINILPHSDDQYMESICPLNNSSYTGGAADHWLISPRLSGNAQTITFWERVITNQYGNETYEILVSSNDIDNTNPSSGFTVLQTINSSELDWFKRTVSLPAGTKYFAIRHISNDIFGMMVDDVTYEAAIEPESYNIYLDGQLVGNLPSTTDPLSYDFGTVAFGEHTASVSAVYPGGIESEAVPAQFTIMDRTAMPTISVVANADGSKTISATGDGTVHLYVDGVEVTNPYTIMPSSDGDISVTVTATAQEEGKLISETAEQIVTVPEVGRSPQPTITFTDNGDGTYTITVEGTGEIAVYIDDADHAGEPIATVNNTFSFNVEQHSQVMTITVTATNQEGDLEVSRPATETYTIPAMTIDSDFKLLDPQPETSESPIDLSKLMFVDRFSVDIPNDNSHPFMYEYTLEETQVRQRSSNTVEVYVEKTGSTGQGFYTLKQLDDDTDAELTMNVMNAAMDFNLSELSAPFFYTVEREEEADGETYWGWNAILQRTSVGNYKQTLKYDSKGNLVYNYNDTILPGEHIQLDLDTITGDYNDYNAYVPVVWTMGFDRVNYNEDDPVHNSYGASVWTTGVAEVNMDSFEQPIAERQTNQWNSVNWEAEGGPASLFILDNVVATAKMPTVNTLEYEPYMFRIFVRSENGKLRHYDTMPQGEGPYDGEHVVAADGSTEGPWCVWSGYVNDPANEAKGVEISITEGDKEYNIPTTITFKKSKVDRENTNVEWTLDDYNAIFGALDEISDGLNQGQSINTKDLEIFVRFYYVVKGSAEGHTPWLPTRDGGNGDSAGYGAESGGGSAGVATSVNEIRYHGDVVSQSYYNIQGMKSDKPFEGVNIVVTRYSDGATVVSKVVK